MSPFLRRVFAPISVSVCFVLILALGAHFYGTVVDTPPILNPKLRYLTKDPVTHMLKPYMWEIDLITGPGDSAFLRTDVVGGRKCLGMHVYQDGAEDSYEWATLHIRQDLSGKTAKVLFDHTFTVRVFPTFPYIHDGGHPRNVFGIEIYDGQHLLWIIFSDTQERTDQIGLHRIVVVNTPLNNWAERKINLGNIYQLAGWQTPNKFSFVFLLGATRGLPGSFAGFIEEIAL